MRKQKTPFVSDRLIREGRFLAVSPASFFVCVFVRLSICPFVRLSVCPFVRLFVCSFVCLSVCLFVCWSVLFLFLFCFFVNMFVCLLVCWCVYLDNSSFGFFPAWLFECLTFYLTAYLCVLHIFLYVCLCVCSTYLPVCLSVCTLICLYVSKLVYFSCFSTSAFVSMPVCLLVCWYFNGVANLTVHLFVSAFACLSAYLFVC